MNHLKRILPVVVALIIGLLIGVPIGKYTGNYEMGLIITCLVSGGT